MLVTALRRSKQSGRQGPGVGRYWRAGIANRVSGDASHRHGARQ
ncbi:hypothetical protein [Paraburkholderia fungorum]|uniref:Uncharacterized protein n=1 Tax=Paraburkholderia fungorum TaxID=134537 RepID=A0AAW3UZ40_9BURK|nr:hypothetical protein [Paraburkholderia fungorum]MBB4515650.1 hypothetical protein [Paraburkholderia fungorum]MBB5547333.1 hypothetical protein [Paraburkholderia fungorum]MBB6203934.1 hypothetical protein [Paraburkholderia fungorum]